MTAPIARIGMWIIPGKAVDDRSTAAALTDFPDTIISSAASAPVSRGSRWVPPAPGKSPSLISGNLRARNRHAVMSRQRQFQPGSDHG